MVTMVSVHIESDGVVCNHGFSDTPSLYGNHGISDGITVTMVSVTGGCVTMVSATGGCVTMVSVTGCFETMVSVYRESDGVLCNHGFCDRVYGNCGFSVQRE